MNRDSDIEADTLTEAERRRDEVYVIMSLIT